MTRKQLELELAEARVALQYLAILSLRNSGVVSAAEITQATRPLTTFRALPGALREQIIQIRKQRWNIQ